MPRRLSWRIGIAFAVLAASAWVVIGAALFLVLRGLHADATTATLNDVATPLVAQARQRLPRAGDIRTVLSDLGDQVQAQGYMVYLVTADGRVVSGDLDAPPVDTVRIAPSAGRGATFDGTFRDGAQPYAWVAVVLRQPQAAGPRALVLATPDRSAGDALRDVVAVLPPVVIVSLLIGAPIAWLIGRSVTQPLRRLSSAASSLPAGRTPPPPLPLDGPTEVRDLTARFNAMTAEIANTRREEADLLANLRHDLRTPVTVISGFAAALTDGTATGDDIPRAARAIGEEAARLEDLVGQLGAFERLDSADPRSAARAPERGRHRRPDRGAVPYERRGRRRGRGRHRGRPDADADGRPLGGRPHPWQSRRQRPRGVGGSRRSCTGGPVTSGSPPARSRPSPPATLWRSR